MLFPVQVGKASECAKDMTNEYRRVRELAREAFLDEDMPNFILYKQQMIDMLSLDFYDGVVTDRVVNYLSPEEQRNPFGFTTVQLIGAKNVN